MSGLGVYISGFGVEVVFKSNRYKWFKYSCTSSWMRKKLNFDAFSIYENHLQKYPKNLTSGANLPWFFPFRQIQDLSNQVVNSLLSPWTSSYFHNIHQAYLTHQHPHRKSIYPLSIPTLPITLLKIYLLYHELNHLFPFVTFFMDSLIPPGL